MSEDRPNVHALPDRERDKQKAASERVKRLMADPERLAEEARTIAQLRKIQFEALREAGFNEYQALVIVAKMY